MIMTHKYLNESSIFGEVQYQKQVEIFKT